MTEPVQRRSNGHPPRAGLPLLLAALLILGLASGAWFPAGPGPFAKAAWADDDGGDDDGNDDSGDDGGSSDNGDDDGNGDGGDDGDSDSGDDGGDGDGDDGSDGDGDGDDGSDGDGDGDDGSDGDDDSADDGDDDGGDGEEEDEEGEEASEEGHSAATHRLLPQWPEGESGDPFRPRDSVVVADLSAAELALLEARGFRVRDALRLLGLELRVTRLRPPPGMSAEAAAAELRRLVPRRTVDLDHRYRLQRGGCEGGGCWQLRLVDWTGDLDGCRPRRPVGMIDTGVDPGHPALREAVLEVRHLVEGARADPGHGTAVAALLVGRRGVGLLPGSRLLVADVFTVDEAGPVTGPLEIARGLDWLLRSGASPINLSLAGPDNAVLRLAVARVLEGGGILVAAAGNGGPRAAPAYPAAYPGVIAVTAVDRELRPYPRANRGPYIAFAAPGVGLPAGDGRSAVSGTSYATPFVTAAAALLLRGGGARTPAALEDALARRARDLGPPGRDPVFGWGLVRRPRGCGS